MESWIAQMDTDRDVRELGAVKKSVFEVFLKKDTYVVVTRPAVVELGDNKTYKKINTKETACALIPTKPRQAKYLIQQYAHMCAGCSSCRRAVMPAADLQINQHYLCTLCARE